MGAGNVMDALTVQCQLLTSVGTVDGKGTVKLVRAVTAVAHAVIDLEGGNVFRAMQSVLAKEAGAETGGCARLVKAVLGTVAVAVIDHVAREGPS